MFQPCPRVFCNNGLVCLMFKANQNGRQRTSQAGSKGARVVVNKSNVVSKEVVCNARMMASPACLIEQFADITVKFLLLEVDIAQNQSKWRSKVYVG
ncbi:hypothetical protein EYC80_007080 [Monilinia laxa]|uniref:Uncharacterized protein n=1 Tax=Monilinia laxa TaxID=61186 RepID=A0A5N6K047_MONLA|nr:hypothetical protein EYC80_007080 [Monilinia laxa]